MKNLLSILITVVFLGVVGLSVHSTLGAQHVPGSIVAIGVATTVTQPSLQDPDGAALFQQHCSSCHGKEGKGDGPAAAALDPKPRDFSVTEWQESKTDEELTTSITDGVGKMMPPYKQLKPEEIKALVAFIRTLDDE
jgi:mono/diheme cytochrome c family protein